MDVLDIVDNIVTRAYNSNALPKIKRLLRIIEIILILAFLTSATTRLPLVIQVTREYMRRLVIFIVSPFFIFLIGNIIVLTLFFKSRHDNIQHHEYQNSQISPDTLFDSRHEFISSIDRFPLAQGSENNVVFQDKQTIFEVTKSTNKVVDDSNCISCGTQLDRSEMETRRRVVDGGEVAVEMVDQLSNEEFKREIDAFIAKQIKFHHQEKMAIVLHGCI